MWTRFGTPTKIAGSGTEGEFRRAIDRHTADPGAVALKFYFKDAPIEPSRINPDQLSRVLNFKGSIGNDFGAYVATFRDSSDFDSKIRVDLFRTAQELASRATVPQLSTTLEESAADGFKPLQSEVLRNLHSLDSSDEQAGFFESLDRGNRAAVAMTRAIGDIGETAASLFQAVDRANKQMAVTKLPGVKIDGETARLILDGITARFDVFVNDVSDPIVKFHAASVDMKASFDESISIIEESWEYVVERQPIIEVADTLDFLVSSIGEARRQLSVLKNIVGQCPRLSVRGCLKSS